jgi:hypothetical protein
METHIFWYFLALGNPHLEMWTPLESSKKISQLDMACINLSCELEVLHLSHDHSEKYEYPKTKNSWLDLVSMYL